MATKKISELPAAAALTGTEQVPVVQSAATVRTTTGALIGQALVKASNLSDLPSAVAARGNLGLGTAATTATTAYDAAGTAATAAAAAKAAAIQRANHTGAQAISTVTGLQAALDAKAPVTVTGIAVGTPSGSDDELAIAAARTAAGAGGTIVFAGGVYLTDGIACSTADQRWVVMPAATVKLKNAANAPVFDVTANGVTIEGGGTIDGNRANQSDGTTGLTSAIRIVSRSKVKVRDLTIRDSLSHAVYIDASSKVQVRNNDISGCGPTGNQKQVLVYDTTGSSSDIRISGNDIDSTGSTNGCIAITTAIAGRTIRKLRITGNHCKVGIHGSADTLGIELFTSGTATISDVTVSNNVVEGPTGVLATDSLYGISIGGTASNAANGVHTVACGDNVIKNCPTAAIEVVGNGVACTGNTAVASGAFSINAVSTTGGLVGTTMVGNTSVDCVNLAYALFLEGGTHGLFSPVVTGNTITGAASASVIATAGTITGAIIAKNAVRDCVGVPLILGGTFTDGTVSTNSFDLTGAGAGIDGILIGSTGVSDTGIISNKIKGATRSAIHGLVATSNMTIDGNRIRSCQDGIKAVAVQTLWTVVNNKIRNCVDRGLIFSPGVEAVSLSIASNSIHNNPGGDYFTTDSTFLAHVINGAGG